jgi:spore coat protein A, manganese oxidase
MSIPLDPNTVPKFVHPLVIPPVYEPTVVETNGGDVIFHDYTVDVSEFNQQILPPTFPETTVWGYGGIVKDPQTGNPVYFRNAPGATFEAIRRIPISVQWVNNLIGPHLLPVDPTLHWADPNELGMMLMPPFPPFPPGFPLAQQPVPIVPHLHGGESPSDSDGHPDAWFTANEAIKGPTFVKSRYHYTNNQEPTTLWYHDHLLGATRLNVIMGLAGFYLLRDPGNPLDGPDSVLPRGQYEIPIVIQDRSFNEDGSFAFPTVGVNPDIHPYWVPEFFGDTIMVNGKVWPNLDVEPRQYRFRVLNGSNARFYNLSFDNQMPFVQIGSDGGYLPKPVEMTSLLIAPGERADILVDFSLLSAGTKLVLTNDANAPFPNGDAPDPMTVGRILQFTVINQAAVVPPQLPIVLNNIPTLTPNASKRTLVLVEVGGPNGPLEVLLDGQKWHAPISELPLVGSTEDWELVNLTMDAHPIHLHLVQFQLVSRQALRSADYLTDWVALNGNPPLNQPTQVIPVDNYLLGQPSDPAPNEQGWKDTIQVYPDQVTTIRARFAPQLPNQVEPGLNLYPFDPAQGPGYVWHCHILDHEDNEMMRPLKVKVDNPGFTNTASVSSFDKSILCGTVNSQDSVNTVILAASNALTITKAVSASEICAGEVITYNLTIRNSSSTAKTFDLTDRIAVSPSGTILASDLTTSPVNSTITQIPNGLEISWLGVTIPGTNEPGNPNAQNGYYEVTYSILLMTSCNTVGTITNRAEINSSGSTIPSNEVTTLVKAVVHLSVIKTKVSPADPVYIGDTIKYNIAVTNRGPCDATGVYVDDVIPAAAIIVSDPNWVFQSGTTYRYTIGTLPAGITTNITIEVIPISPITK